MEQALDELIEDLEEPPKNKPQTPTTFFKDFEVKENEALIV